MPRIYPLAALSDNYIWVIQDKDKVWVVDPGNASPVIAHIQQKHLSLQGMLLTHQHPDHWQGVAALLDLWTVPVYGPERMPDAIATNIQYILKEGDSVSIANLDFQVMEIPGHTAEHIAYFCPRQPDSILFVGDTLFAAGCGRAFYSLEGLYSSLTRIKSLPTNTLIYASHEYTLSNLHFASAIEPGNAELQLRLAECQSLRDQGLPTLPTSLARELKTNPFLRLDQPAVQKAAELAANSTLNCDFDVFSALRNWKNHY